MAKQAVNRGPFILMREVIPQENYTLYYKYTLPDDIIEQIKKEATKIFGREPNEIINHVQVAYVEKQKDGEASGK